MYKKLLFLFLITITSITAQNRKILFGKARDSIGVIKNAHIINLQTNQATFTNNTGHFKIFAKVGDSLKITSIQYQTKIYTVNNLSFKFNALAILLKRKVYQLNEVVVNSNNLSGILEIDMRKTPKDKKAEILKKLMDFSNIDMDAPLKDDYIKKHVKPPIVKTDPTTFFIGISLKIPILIKQSKNQSNLRRELAFKKSFPEKILNELGENFFFKELQIPKKHYYHFLDYCNQLTIEKLYKQGKMLEIIKILQQEQKSFLKTIKKE
ncbi:hypothetical protein [Tenacibaculum sp. UWU-22]|uniref:hypothetical protein n=1 Tax=Tenacibaculum sp. UWU-22 TaxID=3234187 RepID=UPI0034DB7302